MVKSEDGLREVGDAVGAAVEFPRQVPTLECDHGLFADAAEPGVGDVVSALPSFESSSVVERDAHVAGRPGSWFRPGPGRPRCRAYEPAVRSWAEPGRAGDDRYHAMRLDRSMETGWKEQKLLATVVILVEDPPTRSSSR